MKNIYRIIIVIFTSLSLFSCNDFLGNKPKGYTIPQYFEDFALLMNGSALGNLGEGHPAFLTDDALLGGANEPSFVDYTKKFGPFQACYDFRHGDIYPEGIDDGYFTKAYSQIFTYNVVINNILNVPDATDKDKKALQAEALVQRAYTYFKLVNVYAKQYDKFTADKDYGVPLVLSEDISKPYDRQSIAQVYEQIIYDLNSAFPNLKEVTANSFHANKASCAAILAKVQLFMGDYSSALKNINIAYSLCKGVKLIDYKLYKALDQGKYQNRIVEISSGLRFPYPIDDSENILLKNSNYDLSSLIFASKDLISVFKKNLPANAIDKRFELFYAVDKANTFANITFPGFTMYVSHLMPNLGVTYQEVLLILAECEARASEGSLEKSLSYLDKLRNMRIVNNTPLKVSTKEEALQLALDERRREMAFWGDTRFLDLKRLNKDERFAKTIVHTVLGEEVTLPPNDPRYIMPLPYSVRELNPNIPQYER